MNTQHAESRAFTYSRHAQNHIATVIGLVFLLLVEGSLVVLFVATLISDPTVKWTVLGLLLALYLLAALYLFAPFTTRHCLTATHLQLRFGLQIHADIPREAILSAQALARPEPSRRLGPQYDAEQQRLVLVLAERGQVLLQLDRAYPFRIGLFAHGQVAQVLFNVDDRDDLLAMLHVPVVSPAAEIVVPDAVHVPVPVSPSGDCAIRTEGLSRRYGSVVAVDHLNLGIARGELFGFLGLNGAGKTTSIKMLVGLLEPNGGHAWIDGHEVWAEPLAAKAALGYVADRAILYERLTGREFLEFLAQMRGISQARANERIPLLLDLLELAEHQGRLTGSYSFGMKRKLALAGALLHEPPVLILDEPFTGLDPRSARHLKDLLVELAGRGTTVLLSTHDLATAEAVCHRVGILHRGHLIALGTAAELRAQSAALKLEDVFLALTAEKAA